MKDRNENRPGYKKTKVGWIPQEWEIQPFGYMTRKSQYGLSINSSEIGKTPILRMGNIEDGKVTYKNLSYVNVSDLVQYQYSVKKNDLLFNRTNSLDLVGKTGIVTESKPVVFASYLIRFQIDDSLAFPLFVAYYFNTPESRVRIKKLATPGVGQHNINQTELQKHFLIPLPSLPEQKKIAEIFLAWDEAIERTRKLTEVKKRRKKALMQQLLTGKKRLQPYAKRNRKNSYRFFDLPEDWACPQIKEIALECSERNTGRDDLPVLACSKHLGFVESSEYFGKRVFSEDTSNYKIIKRGQFGFPSNHIEEGSIGLVQKQDIGLVSPIYTVFKCNDNIIPEYLYAVFKTDTFRHIFKVSTNASVDRRGSLRWREFSLIHIPMPTIEEQEDIASVLKTSDDEMIQIEAKLKILKEQKRGLMQKLLTGEVRVRL